MYNFASELQMLSRSEIFLKVHYLKLHFLENAEQETRLWIFGPICIATGSLICVKGGLNMYTFIRTGSTTQRNQSVSNISSCVAT